MKESAGKNFIRRLGVGLLALPLVAASARPVRATESTDYLTALTDRSNDIGVPSEGYGDSPYTVSRDVWPGTSLNARDSGNERNIGGTFWLNKNSVTSDTFTNDQYWDGKAPFRITPKDGQEGLSFTFFNYNDFALEDDDDVVPNAAFKIDHVTIYSGASGVNGRHNFYGRGNKLVIGEGVTVATQSRELIPRDVAWRIYGGTEHNRDLSGDGRPDLVTNVVVASGEWDAVFGGGEGATGTGTQVTIRGTADVENVYGGGERKGSVGVDEAGTGNNKGNPNNPGINVFVEGGSVGTLYGGSAINGRGWLDNDFALKIYEDINIDVSGGYVDRIFGGDDTHDDNGDSSGVQPVDHTNMSESPICGDLTVNLSGDYVTRQVVGDINRNIPRAATQVRQVLGVDRLNITADQQLDYMELFDTVNIDGANVIVNNELGFTAFDADYSGTEGYIGQIAVTNGGRLELTGRAVINEPYAHYNQNGQWDYNWTEKDNAPKATANHNAYYLRHGWIGEADEADRADSVIAIDGAEAGITAAGGTAFNDSTDVCGLLIHGSVGGAFGGTNSWNADVAGYSTLEVLGDPIYSTGDDYYYYIVADGSASNTAGTASTAPVSVNGGAAFREPEGADYVVCYRYLDGGKIGWYLREKPDVTAANRLAHVGETGEGEVSAHVSLGGFAYEWSSTGANNRVGIQVTRYTGADSVTETDDTNYAVSTTDLADLASDPRFSNIVYDNDGLPQSFDVLLDGTSPDEAAYYEIAVVFLLDDERAGAATDCARCVYDFVNTTRSDSSDYQESILSTTPYETAPQGADRSLLRIEVPYGCAAASLAIGENDGTFTMTNEDDGSAVTASLHAVQTLRDDFADAPSATANTAFAVDIDGADLSAGVTLTDLTGAGEVPCTVYSYKNVTAFGISNVRASVIARDAADGIPGQIGEVDASGSADGLVLSLALSAVTRNGESVGTGGAAATNYGELRIRAVPADEIIVPPPTGTEDLFPATRALLLLAALGFATFAAHGAIKRKWRGN